MYHVYGKQEMHAKLVLKPRGKVQLEDVFVESVGYCLRFHREIVCGCVNGIGLYHVFSSEELL
jgi:hypothetical protein